MIAIVVTIIIIGFVLAVIDQFTGKRLTRGGYGKLFGMLTCIGVAVLVASNVGLGIIGYCILGFIGFCVMVPVCMAIYIATDSNKSNTAVDAYIKSQQDARK